VIVPNIINVINVGNIFIAGPVFEIVNRLNIKTNKLETIIIGEYAFYANNQSFVTK